MNRYIWFDTSDCSDANSGYSVLAHDKKAAHEMAQVLRPGHGIEVYSPTELDSVRIVNRERDNIGLWMQLLQLTITEHPDAHLAMRRLSAMKRCIEVLEDHFSDLSET